MGLAEKVLPWTRRSRHQWEATSVTTWIRSMLACSVLGLVFSAAGCGEKADEGAPPPPEAPAGEAK